MNESEVRQLIKQELNAILSGTEKDQISLRTIALTDSIKEAPDKSEAMERVALLFKTFLSSYELTKFAGIINDVKWSRSNYGC